MFASSLLTSQVKELNQQQVAIIQLVLLTFRTLTHSNSCSVKVRPKSQLWYTAHVAK